MKNVWLFIFLCSLQFSVSAQMDDYLPLTPANRLQIQKNYKQYISTHGIHSVSNLRTDTISTAKTIEKFISFTPEGDTALLYDYFSKSCYKRIVNHDAEGKIVDEYRYLKNDTVNPDFKIKYLYSGARFTETTLLAYKGKPVSKRTSYSYDKNGGFSEVEHFDNNSKTLSEKEVYIYDGSRLSSIRFETRDSGAAHTEDKMHIASVTQFIYDDAQRIKIIKYFIGNSERLKRTESFDYDSRGNLIHYRGLVDKPAWTVEMKYDEKQSVILCEFIDGNKNLKRSIATTYDQAGNLSQETDSSFDNDHHLIQKKVFKYRYSADFSLSSCEHMIDNRHVAKINYKYKFYKTSGK
jgi:hypothetical protein